MALGAQPARSPGHAGRVIQQQLRALRRHEPAHVPSAGRAGAAGRALLHGRVFLDLGAPGDALAHDLRAAVRRAAKIPTCIGIGPTKTVVKLANALVKDNPGMAACATSAARASGPGGTSGCRSARCRASAGATEKPAALGIDTVARSLAMRQREARGLLTVVGAGVQAELRGVTCLPLSMVAPTRKGVAVTRSFGRPVTVWAEMREAVAHHAVRAGEKLRAEGLVAGRRRGRLACRPAPRHRRGARHQARATAGRARPPPRTRAARPVRGAAA